MSGGVQCCLLCEIPCQSCPHILPLLQLPFPSVASQGRLHCQSHVVPHYVASKLWWKLPKFSNGGSHPLSQCEGFTWLTDLIVRADWFLPLHGNPLVEKLVPSYGVLCARKGCWSCCFIGSSRSFQTSGKLAVVRANYPCCCRLS